MHLRRVVAASFLMAMGTLLMMLEFPLPLFPGYLKYDPGDLPGILAAFLMGPLWGVAVEIGKDLLFLLSGRSSAGIVGVSANAVAGIALVAAAGWVYHFGRRAGQAVGHADGRRAALALAAGSVAMAGAMAVANYAVFLPLWGIPRGEAAGLIAAAIIPFNLIKAVATSALALPIFLRLAARAQSSEPAYAPPRGTYEPPRGTCQPARATCEPARGAYEPAPEPASPLRRTSSA